MSRNRLASETSPYLLQHQDNPVHWWAWGPEALAKAKATNKPILLSVGYAACHWCHVMAHESFEDEPTAAVMNELYVNIKVDREERPDIDAIYMGALHALGQQGGWPLTMFLDSDARPFWGGTYFPKESRFGRPAFVDVLRQVSRIHAEDPARVAHNAEVLTEALKASPPQGPGALVNDEILAQLTIRMARAVDPAHGGINGAPKFPQWSFFWLLWRGGIRYDYEPARKAVEHTLVNICQGGIYDHLGGGFARYSVDERWLAPHFEKMLYDNALLIDLMTDVWRETQNPLLNVRIAETVAWLEREMIAEGGGFAASLDADSEGEEGKFYVWTLDEIAAVLGPEDTRFFAQVYDVTSSGNWEGHTILNRLERLTLLDDPEEMRLAAMRGKLLAARDRRIRPGWDDKVLADWNGLMIAALARAAIVFEEPRWLNLASRAFAFVRDRMTVDGRLRHSFRAGRASAPAAACDYANMIAAALRLHQATLDASYLEIAQHWAEVLEQHYWRAEGGGYHQAADDTADVIVRLCSGQDEATPNANTIMISNLVALSVLTGDTGYFEQAADTLAAFAVDMNRSLVAHAGLLANAIDIISPQQIVIAETNPGDGVGLMEALHQVALPGALEYRLAQAATGTDFFDGKTGRDGRAAAYACLGPLCSPPIADVELLSQVLYDLRRSRNIGQDRETT